MPHALAPFVLAAAGDYVTLRWSMSLPELLPITPFTRPAHGDVTIPGSKSLTNRALLLSALSDRPVTLTGALFSEDTHLMAESLRRLGFSVEGNETTSTLEVGRQENGFSVGEADVFVGLAGTAARFLTAFCAAAPRGQYRLDGVPQMRKRPMNGLIAALRKMGAEIRCTGDEGFFPIEIHATGLKGGPVQIDATESSQMLSALLMVAPRASGAVEIRLAGNVRWPFVEMTIRQMREFGYSHEIRRGTDHVSVAPGRYAPPTSYAIEPDATAASYFAALPIVTGGSVDILKLLGPAVGLQGDARFLDVVARLGARVSNSGNGITVSAATGIKPPGLAEDFREFSDTFLTLAAIAPLLAGPTRITGIAHTRKQETDRVAGMARELARLGQHVIETNDSLEIHPRPLRAGTVVETYHDHRFAMSFGILGCYDLHGDGRSWLTIRNPACCAKTFPHFFALLETLRTNSLGR